MYRDDLEAARATIRTLEAELYAQRKRLEAAEAETRAAKIALDEATRCGKPVEDDPTARAFAAVAQPPAGRQRAWVAVAAAALVLVGLTAGLVAQLDAERARMELKERERMRLQATVQRATRVTSKLQQEIGRLRRQADRLALEVRAQRVPTPVVRPAPARIPTRLSPYQIKALERLLLDSERAVDRPRVSGRQ